MRSRLTRNLRWVSPASAHPEKTLAASAPTPFSAADTYPEHDPPLAAREEAIYLMHIASEVEHALMVQYLYAAFSLGGPQVPAAQRDAVRRWRTTILGIAREEMGHLSTVQNILQLIGGPLTFEREDFPIPKGLYPFPFQLQPLTQASLAMYVVAEMPALDSFQPGTPERAEIEAIMQVAQQGNQDQPVDRVGILYARVIALLNDVITSDFDAASLRFQARSDEWGLNYPGMLILTAGNRADAQAQLGQVAEQGEGAAIDHDPNREDTSHFGRFLNIYRQFPKDSSWTPARPMPLNPTTSDEPLDEPVLKQEPITNPQARLWAQLFNQRYRLLLMYLSHAFCTEGRMESDGGRTPRGLLVSWSFGEMYNLRSIADILATLPLHRDGTLDQVAGPPFEMPYSLSLPDREPDRWRQHRDIITASAGLIDALSAHQNDAHADYLNGLRSLDAAAVNIMIPMIAG